MANKDYVLYGRAQEIADRFSTSGTEEMLTAAIVALVQEYVRNAKLDAPQPRRFPRPNCF
jgi:hypothetical protein